MNIDSLREEISIQLEYLDATVDEIKALQIDLESRQPTVRELAASAKFLADFYTGCMAFRPPFAMLRCFFFARKIYCAS